MTLQDQDSQLETVFDDAQLGALPPAASDAPCLPGGLSEKETKILRCLSDGTAWRNARIEAETGIVLGLSGLLQKLAERGHLRKMRNGVWCIAGAPDDVHVPKPYHRLPRQADLLRHLHDPATIDELSARTSLSLRRAAKMLQQLQEKGYLRREGELWVLKGSPAPEMSLLSRREQLVLRSFPDHLVTDQARIGAVAGLNCLVVRRILVELERQGLAELAEFPRRMACRLTDAGRRHPVRDLPAPRAAMMTQKDAGAPAMMDVLRVLNARGALQTRALSTLLQGALADRGLAMGNYIQRMRKQGWIEPVDDTAARPFYRCTVLGARLASWLNEIALPVEAG